MNVLSVDDHIAGVWYVLLDTCVRYKRSGQFFFTCKLYSLTSTSIKLVELAEPALLPTDDEDRVVGGGTGLLLNLECEIK